MIGVRPKGGISELNFGYNAKMEVYTNSSSDITKLDAISNDTERIREEIGEKVS